MSEPRPTPQGPERVDLDRLRDAQEGRLSPMDRDALAARRAADPELDAMARDLEALDALGMADVDPVPACTVSFDAAIRPALEDERSGERPADSPPGVLRGDVASAAHRPVFARWAPFVAAAAAVLVLLTGLLARRSEAGPVALRAIALEDVMPPPPLPKAALDYVPAGPSGLRFVEGLKAGKELAAATARPLVVFVHHPTCPMCRELERGPFRDAALAPAAAGFVLARANVMAEGGALLKGVEVEWPAFLVFDLNGARVDAFAGAKGMQLVDARTLAADFEAAFHVAAKAAAPRGDAKSPATTPSWDIVHDVAQKLADADQSPDAGERWRRLGDAAAAAKSTSLEPRVRAVMAASTADARLALAAAKSFAESGRAAEAADVLEKAAAKFRGSPVEDDLRRVRERLVADGKFPALEAAR